MTAYTELCKCTVCNQDILDEGYVCKDCYQEKDRQVKDLLAIMVNIEKLIQEVDELLWRK